MELLNNIKKDTVQAMKSKETAKLSTLRLLVAEIEKEMKLTGITEVTDEKVKEVISRQIKKLDKEIEAYVAVNRSTEKQEVEKELLISYLPKQLTDEEIVEHINHAVDLVVRGEIKNPMQYLSQRLKGKADMGKVAQLLKRK